MAVISRRSGAYAVALVAIAACVTALVSLAPAASSAVMAADVTSSCALAPAPGHVACLSSIHRLVAVDPAQGYGPDDLDALYALPGSVRQGAPAPNTPTVAVIDVGHDLHAASDLAAYRSHFGLPACTKASGCLTEIDEDGHRTGLPAMPRGDDWGGEISLDLDMVSAICPACNLLLVDAATTASKHLVQAVREATAYPNHGRPAHYVSMSFGGAEPLNTAADNELNASNDPFTAPGAAYVAASGDCGFRVTYGRNGDAAVCGNQAGASWPAVLPTVVGTGGVSAQPSDTVWSLKAWNGAGSGCAAGVPSATVPLQAAVVTAALALTPTAATECQGRATSDISAAADNENGVLVYYTSSYRYVLGRSRFAEQNGCTPKGKTYDPVSLRVEPCSPWEVAGGTSAAAPQIAAMYALADDVSTPLLAVSNLYQNQASTGADFQDVTEGSTTGCHSNDGALCSAAVGWDGPTGLGIPDGLGAFTLTGAAPGTFAASGTSVVSGWARRGAVLTAAPATVVDAATNEPVTGAVTTLQWLRGGEPIARATNSTYQLVGADVGHRISYRVTTTAAAYVPFSYPAPATATVKK